MARAFKPCAVDECNRSAAEPGSGRGWCGMHYQRWKRNGDPLVAKYDRQNRGAPCSVDGCENVKKSRGLCQLHYDRMRTTGSTEISQEFCKRQRWVEENASFYGLGCLIWPFGVNANGRGQLKYNGKLMSAPRAMCIAAHGLPPTPKHHAAHSCGNGHLGCMNPGHLSWKTPRENEADKIIHGTLRRGRDINTNVLSESDVREIRKRLKRETGVSIAKDFGVTAANISAIKTGKNWGWLE